MTIPDVCSNGCSSDNPCSYCIRRKNSACKCSSKSNGSTMFHEGDKIKGGINNNTPTSPRPSNPPMGQGSSNTSLESENLELKAELLKAYQAVIKIHNLSHGMNHLPDSLTDIHKVTKELLGFNKE